MTIKVGASGGSSYPFPTLPTPVKDDGRIMNTADLIPHKGSAIDNIDWPNAYNQNIVGMLNESVVWTVTPANINAAVDGFAGTNGVWYDSVNDRLYVFAIDLSTTPDSIYTAYITLETGAVTNIGNFVLTTQPATMAGNGSCAVHRAAIDSGNFTLYFKDRTIVINESTGAEISNVASTNTGQNNEPGGYVTLDGTIFASNTNTTSSSGAMIQVTRGAQTVRVAVPTPYFAAENLGAIYFMNWGDKVKLFAFSAGVNYEILRTFTRTDFDALLAEIADFGGLA